MRHVMAAAVLAVALAGTGTLPARGAPDVAGSPSWKQVFADDFNGRALNTENWSAYSGQPGGNPDGWWEQSHVIVRDGFLVLRGYRSGGRFVTGGVSSGKAVTETYGKYLVRFRIDPGVGVKYALLLWPQNRPWPEGGEIDFAESDTRTDTKAYLHYGKSNSQVRSGPLRLKTTDWHTLGVEWSPGRLVYTVDGRAWATVDSGHVPTSRMALDLQSEATVDWGSGTPAEVDAEIDWVRIYALAS